VSASWDLDAVALELSAAALDPSRWRPTLQLLSDSVGAVGAVLLPPIGQRLHAICTESVAEVSERYIKEGWYTRDLRDRCLHKATQCGAIFEKAISSLIIDNEAFTDAAVTCLDQDPLSCEEVKRRFAKCKVTVLNRNVTAALRLTDTNYDLIYAAGLYDYLNEKVAVRLNAHLISILAPGGRLVVPNFLQSAPNRASMELLQDWFLIYRDENEIRSLVAKALDSHQQISYFETEDASIGYALFDR
jgi:hypothetical protein